ncbi:MAG: trypsin-like peptidase domain-containing protein [Planctomycetaceae bacterium]
MFELSLNRLSRRNFFASLTLASSLAIGLQADTLSAGERSELRNTPIVRAVNDASPATVNIHGRKVVKAEAGQANAADGVRQVNGMGTGIIIDPRGYILTNYHVVDGVSNIQVSLYSKQDTVARLISHDPKTDLALIKIDVDKPLPVPRLGTSCDLMAGETVIAIGNAYGYEHTVTTGIVSWLHRSVQVSDEQKYNDLIQTDASINPGNSGGPLLNIDGEVIGINVAVRVGAQGIGFAIPIDEALEVAARLASVERLEKTTHGLIGKTKFDPEKRAFVVQTLRAGSPGESAGLKSGDVVTQINDRPIERALDVELAFLGKPAGEEVTISYLRDETPSKASLALSSLRGGSKATLADRAWSQIGLKLTPMDEAQFQQLQSKYRGGLLVTDVRKDGPAYAQGIRRNDVLVGMHVWETLSMENISYILEREDLPKTEPVVFYIVRGSDTLFGHIRLAERTRP